MRTKLRSKISLLFMTLGLLLAFPAIALADIVADSINDVSTSVGSRTIVAGDTTTVGYRIQVQGGGLDGEGGCNASPASPATVTINTPPGSGVTATPGSLNFTQCDVFQNATFTSEKAGGPHNITVAVNDSGPGTYQTAPATWSLTVTKAKTQLVDVRGHGMSGQSNGTLLARLISFKTDGTTINKPLAGKTVTFKIDGNVVPGTAVTDNNGLAQLNNVNLAGYAANQPHTLTADFAGDDGYLLSTGNGPMLVAPPPDSTAPVITPNVQGTLGNSGWYTSNVSVQWTVSDPDSAVVIDSGCGTQNFTSSTASATSSCSAHSAGGSASDSVTLKIDKEAPDVSVTPNRTPDSNGWYNRAVGFSASGSNYGPSGAGSCDADTSYDGPDSASASVLMSCTDGAGNSGSGSARFMYDDTAPSVTVSLARGADHNGWHNHAVGYGVSARSDATSGIASCDASDTYSGPDDATASVSRTCTDVAGNIGSDTALFKYDATAPTDVATTLNRVADHNGWYNAPVGWTTNGDDLTSGIDTCDSDTYNGPDGTGLTVSGRCVDKAGNPSASVSAAFKYDNTNPNVSGTLARAADHNGWYNTSVSYSFASSSTDDTSGIDSASCTSGTYNGPDGSSVTVTGTCSDNAGNSANGSTPPFKYDNTDPTLAPTISPNPVLLNGSATASANANDATSGVDSSSCDPVNTGTIGANQSVSCSATDKAGNSNTANATYSVKADFNGFLQPIDGHSVNTGKYGRTYPIKWQLRDSSGALISDSAAQLLVATMTGGQKAVSCTSFDLSDSDQLEVSTTGNTALRYDATSDQFIYNYKAPSSGSCYVFAIRNADGLTTQQIDFKFTK